MFKEFTMIALIFIAVSVHAVSLTSSLNMVYDGGSELRITDALGRTIVLESIPSRVVSLAPSITEILFYLGVQNTIVGVDSISRNDTYFNINNYLDKYGVVDVGGYWWNRVDIEAIINLQPDIVFADKGAHSPLLDVFEENNVTVIFLNGGSSSSINDIYFDIDLVAKIFGKEDKALEFINSVESRFATYREKLKDYHGTKILVVVDVYNGIWVAGKATYIDDVLIRLGLENAAEITGWKAVGIEEIYEWSPNAILIASTYVHEDELRDIGLYNLGIPIVFLNQEFIDSLSRPGPLILDVPRYMYDVIKLNIVLVNETTTSTRVDVGVEYTWVFIYVFIAFAIGVITGYLVSRIK